MKLLQSWFPFLSVEPKPTATAVKVDRGPSTGDERELTNVAAGLLRAVPGSEPLAERVAVRWNRRLTSTAGQARIAQSLVLLNPRLTQFPGELDRTLRHELAHLLAYWRTSAKRRKITAHGPEWRQACADLGIADESRCHNLPLPRRRMPRRHAYRCPGCQAVLLRTRAMPRRRSLACRLCCQRHAGGRYDARFRFVKIDLQPSGGS
jgi:SprT protein